MPEQDTMTTPAQFSDAEGWIRGLLEQTLAGIYLIQDGHFQYVNQEFARIFGYESPNDIIGKLPMTQLIAPEDRAKVIENVRLRTAGTVPEMRYAFAGIRRDGRRIDVEVHGRNMDVNGRPAVIGMILDVTERKQAERAKTAFLSVISHELRTPLNHIMGFNGLLLREVDSEKGRAYVAKMEEASKRLLTLIDAILEFSKLEAGRTRLESVEFDVHRVVTQAAQEISHALMQKGMSLITEVAADCPANLTGDAAHIARVLGCMVSNAEKFSEQGQIAIRVNLHTGTDSRLMLRFEVEDHGIGIAQETQSGIFDLFKQGDSSYSRSYGGVGLGLALSKRLVEMMHGEIGFTTTPGQGSIFWFNVPVSYANEKCRQAGLAGGHG
ncbi:MAG: ATP-binding protein [Sulfuritalea sp.]|nr:ATP-binding protein [Sulfuritalea sp.]MDP1985595.1 ATP-binding protein [Sulfuritalea sp.]